ncbi:ribosomal oxygenase 1 [Daktulosphaira vitifoliae]|uniref:ribosomal oxygenase 1 n=1 Tax=Daktulosphaira vitifoliae TaxID=58002 RepID=UPI0021A9BE74|nr:ribosomal oxygenase 1 [Daktulosphaira vitifoliae]
MNVGSAFEFYSQQTSVVSNNKRKTKNKTKKCVKKKIKSGKSSISSNNVSKNTLNQIYSLNMNNSVIAGKKLFEWLIHPININDFMKNHWENSILHVPRNSPNYFSQLFSLEELNSILSNNNLQYGTNVDITSYTNFVRETHNPVGRAFPHVVWDYYNNGCSVRLLNPQLFAPEIYKLMSGLQEYFGSLVGCNIYLTPPFSQGFAPHYDDIEAFVVQVNGEKHWRVYEPLSQFDTLPKISSRNFQQNEIGKPILDVILRPGDFLYMPRGYIHQADTLFTETHSLHLTFSTYQQNSMFDFLKVVVDNALTNAGKNDISYRFGLPIGYQSLGGVCFSDKSSKSNKRQLFETHVNNLVENLKKHIDFDRVIDQFSLKNYYTNSLPPFLNNDELLRTVSNGTKIISNGKTCRSVNLENAEVKLIRGNCFRFVEECIIDEETDCMNNEFRLYYNLDNTKALYGNDCQFVVIPDEMGLYVKKLFNKYPAYIKVTDLCDENEQVLQLINDLWERGLLITSSNITSDE